MSSPSGTTVGKAQIQIGNNCILGGVKIVARNNVRFGDHVLCSWNVFIQDFDPHPIDPREREKQVLHMVASFWPRFGCSLAPHAHAYTSSFSSSPISIGNNVWIGANTILLKGVEIGDDSIVAAGSVVSRGIYPPKSIVAGNPARIVKTLTKE